MQSITRSKDTAQRTATSLRLMPETLEEAKKYAFDHSMSLNALFEEAIEAYLTSSKTQATRSTQHEI